MLDQYLPIQNLTFILSNILVLSWFICYITWFAGDVEHQVCPVILELSRPESIDDFRTEAVAVSPACLVLERSARVYLYQRVCNWTGVSSDYRCIDYDNGRV